jgi:hypothetical protein
MSGGDIGRGDYAMKFDAQNDHDPTRREAFIEWLVAEAASGLQRAAGNAESLRAMVFLYLHRGYEAGLQADLIADLLGITEHSVLVRANLAEEDQQVVLDSFEELDPIIEQMYSSE